MKLSSPEWLDLANGTALGRIDGSWVVRKKDGSLVDLESQPVVGLVLLERNPQELVAEASEAFGFIDGLPLPILVRAAAMSDYWAGHALDWVENVPTSPELSQALIDIETAARVSQRNRHRARRLRLQQARDIARR